MPIPTSEGTSVSNSGFHNFRYAAPMTCRTSISIKVGAFARESLSGGLQIHPYFPWDSIACNKSS